MYARDVPGRTLTFAVSGMLWQRSLVMIDEETESLWSHLLGEAMRGPLTGTTLNRVPSVMTDWGTWRSQHPDTTVAILSRTATQYRRDWYRHPERFVIGYAEGGAARAWRFDALLERGIVNDEVAGRRVLVVFDRKSSTAAVYDRTVHGQTFIFQIQDGTLIDSQTGSQWDILSGRATAGPMKGQRLKRLPATVSFVHSWTRFHPETTVMREEGR